MREGIFYGGGSDGVGTAFLVGGSFAQYHTKLHS
jgi:hypothetical protein